MTQRKPSRRRPRNPPGTAPGTLAVDPAAPAPKIEMISYGPGEHESAFRRLEIASPDAWPERPPDHTVTWVDVSGLGDIETLREVGRRFGLHPLVLEDVVNVTQRPKVEDYGSHLFIVSRMPVVPSPPQGTDAAAVATRPWNDAAWTNASGRLVMEQLAVCVGRDFVVTFQEQPGDAFDRIRDRVRQGKGRMRSGGPDYLAYALLDAALDSFFPLLEAYGERVETLEHEVVQNPEFEHIADIHDLKRNLLTVRRAVWPQREMLSSLLRDETPLVGSETKIFLRDCYDHSIQIIDMTETYREIASGLVDIQLSSISNRMNEIMKVLTIIATIFIPLTFIVGVYGMNFDPDSSPWNMPELRWRYGYPAALLLMTGIFVALLLWFRRRGWIGPKRARRPRKRRA